MTALLRRLWKCGSGTRRPTSAAHGSTTYRSWGLPLRPWHIRGRDFRVVRHGFDPVEVTAFLNRVADDLAAVHAELGRRRDETIRLTNALHG